jgi:hypothetical protein
MPTDAKLAFWAFVLVMIVIAIASYFGFERWSTLE